MKDSEYRKTKDLLDQIMEERKAFDQEEKEYSEYAVALNIISKVMLNGLSKTDMRILHSIIARTSFARRSKFPINQTELAYSMFMKQPNIARTMKKLIAAQMLKKIDKDNYKLLITESFDHSKT